MTQTPALIVRDAIYDRVKAMPFFAGFTFAKNKMLRVQTAGPALLRRLSD